MASYETFIDVPLPLAATFAFVSDFRNAARWDPRTYAVEKITEGPIGVGTRFLLRGGLMTEQLVHRLHLPQSLASMELPYDVVGFDPPNEFLLRGESRLVRYCDHLEFSAADDGTRLRYFAELSLKGPLAIGEPILQRLFKKIGDDATTSIAAVAAAGH